MRSLARLLAGALVAASLQPAAAANPVFSYLVEGSDKGSWPAVLSSIGLVPGQATGAGVIVVREGTPEFGIEWRERLAKGAFLILEGHSSVAEEFGFRPSAKRSPVRSVVDERDRDLKIVWEERLDLPVFDVPREARLFAYERWSGAPLMAGMRLGQGGVLWVATSPGQAGYERFPYLLQALADLGFAPPFRSTRLWAFFDSSYRARVDLDYFARRWRATGISAIHVAAWHFFESDPERDAYLRRLIKSCHRHAVLVYAWLELPHVSEKFWADHPEWREKTAVLQDAHLDWRKLMNLANPDCFRATARGVQDLLDRFDWDGVNLAELYFESLEGAENPARFTPMNEDVRRGFLDAHGFDPLDLFRPDSLRSAERNPGGLREYLDYRAELARKIEEEWIGQIELARLRRPHLDLVLTHVDDRLDTRMRDLIGADAAALLPLLERHDFTFLIEDPASVWHLGPERYTEIASRYQPLAARAEKLSIDINIVERYQDVYPTKQQTGIELYQQVRAAASAFPRVALYAEHSIKRHDEAFLASSASAVDRVEQVGDELVIETASGVGVPWRGGALVNGRLWPAGDGNVVWLPEGAHTIRPTSNRPDMRLLDLSGELRAAYALDNGIEFAYRSSTRAIAVVDREPVSLEIDAAAVPTNTLRVRDRFILVLPRGQHVVQIHGASPAVNSHPAGPTSAY